jgi:hypothetical protein
MTMSLRQVELFVAVAAAAARLPGIRALSLPSEATVPVAVCRRAGAPASAAAEAFDAYLVRHLGDGRRGGPAD